MPLYFYVHYSACELAANCITYDNNLTYKFHYGFDVLWFNLISIFVFHPHQRRVHIPRYAELPQCIVNASNGLYNQVQFAARLRWKMYTVSKGPSKIVAKTRRGRLRMFLYACYGVIFYSKLLCAGSNDMHQIVQGSHTHRI